MIVSKAHRFIFFHNPKAGGTSVRAAIERFNDGPSFWGIREIRGRPVDLAHQTTADFAANFPDFWAEIRDFEKHCLIRQPLARFHSSVREYWRNFGGLDFRFASQKQVAQATLDAVKMLEPFGSAEAIPGAPELAHFKAQSRFAAEDVRLWRSVPALLAHISAVTGAEIVEERRKVALTFPAPLRPLARFSLLRRMPGQALIRSLLGRKRPVVHDSRVEAFVAEFYQSDAKLFERN